MWLMQVGAGPDGLGFATSAKERGHDVTLFDSETILGGQVSAASALKKKSGLQTHLLGLKGLQ